MKSIFFIALFLGSVVLPKILPAQPKDILVEKVTNNVQIGPVAGNRNLEFGVKNILEEFLLEKEYTLNSTSSNKLQVEIIFLDVVTTKKNISVFH